MIGLIGRYLRLLHNLSSHVWWDVTLNAWLIVLLLFIALPAFFGVIPGGVTIAGVMLGLILVLLFSQWWAKRRYYVAFRPLAFADEAVSSLPLLSPKDKVLLRATGFFVVEGDNKRLTDLVAYYRTFETREHAIMARKTPGRFLGLGRSMPDIRGMWYIFISPESLQKVTVGNLYFGPTPQPALRLDYKRFNNKGAAKNAVAFLSFETEHSLRLVFNDLLWDTRGDR